MLKKEVTIKYEDGAVEKVSKVEQQVLLAEESLMAIKVNTPGQLDEAIDGLRRVKALSEVIEDVTEPFRSAAWDYYQGVLATKKRLTAPLANVISHLRGEVASFHERASVELVVAARELERSPTPHALMRFEDHRDQVLDAEMGVEYREYFSAEVEDMPLFLKWCVEVDRHDLLLPNKVELNKMARRMGVAFNVPGCQVNRKVTPVLK
jgi:hypothetical protein